MNQTILIIIGIVGVVILVLVLNTRFRTKLHRGKEKVVGICAVALEQSAKKEENKEKILELLQKRGGLSNSDIRETLGFSERSVVRYMEELEKVGKVEQVGETGRNVIYRLKSKDHATGHLKS